MYQGGLCKSEHHFSDILAFGPHGTGEDGAPRVRLVSVSATRVRGRTVEVDVLPIHSIVSTVTPDRRELKIEEAS